MRLVHTTTELRPINKSKQYCYWQRVNDRFAIEGFMQKEQLEIRSVVGRKREKREHEEAYKFFVPQCARREIIKHQTPKVGLELNIYLLDSTEAKKLILAWWGGTIYAIVDEYLTQYSRTLCLNQENLGEKYLQPLHSILKERDAASVELAGFLMELGYE